MATHDEGCPKLIYHVVQCAHWNPAMESGSTYLPPTFEQDGFIHATHDGNLLVEVLNCFYADVKDDFLCLELDTSVLTSPVKMEPAAPVGDKQAEGTFVAELLPHIYGPIAPLSCVVRKLPVQRDEAGKFLSINEL